jgi:two-component system cell cycle response regulator CpdR
MSDGHLFHARTLHIGATRVGVGLAALQPQFGKRHGLAVSVTMPAPSPAVRFEPITMTTTAPANRPSASDTARAQIPRAKLRVLLVEDEANVRQVARRVLTFAGLQVVAAPNGAEGLETLRREHGLFDVVLSDILMPEMDGVEFAIRAKAEFPNLRFVFMTGFSDISQDRERASGLCEAILGKPFDMDELVGTLFKAAKA